MRLEDDDEVDFVKELDDNVLIIENWENATILPLFLKNVYATTKRISKNLHVTSNNYLFENISIFTTLNGWENDSNYNLKLMAKMKLLEMTQHYSYMGVAAELVRIVMNTEIGADNTLSCQHVGGRNYWNHKLLLKNYLFICLPCTSVKPLEKNHSSKK